MSKIMVDVKLHPGEDDHIAELLREIRHYPCDATATVLTRRNMAAQLKAETLDFSACQHLVNLRHCGSQIDYALMLRRSNIRASKAYFLIIKSRNPAEAGVFATLLGVAE